MGESKGSNKPSEIKRCSCEHKAQDQIHGLGNRVHNPNGKGQYKCTVCGKLKEDKSK